MSKETFDSSMGLASLSHIKANLDRIFGKDAWKDWELETISLELKVIFDELARDKIQLLQVLEHNSKLAFEDMAFFLHAVEVINNKIADFDSMPMPTSLELAYAVKELEELSGTSVKALADNTDLIDVVSYLLSQEGYSEPIAPFDFIPKDRLVPGQTKEDTEAKKRAIEIYTKEMNSL